MILQELNVMLIRTLYSEQASIIAAVVCSLIVAGLLKGTIGVGMPVVALPLLSLFIDIKAAAMLLSMPLCAPETFKKLVLIAVIAAGAELLRHGFFS
jgi:hypothetical protein